MNEKGEKIMLDIALVSAAREGDIESLQRLLKQGASPDGKDDIGCTGLMITTHLEAARFLLDNGADPDMTNGAEMTALMWAAYYRRWEIVDLLIERGADFNKKDKWGRNVLDMARDSNDLRMLERLQSGSKAREERLREEKEARERSLREGIAEKQERLKKTAPPLKFRSPRP